jgi:hypothetical protein
MLLCGAIIAIPYFRGKTDLLTAWNVLLMGIGMWVGFGCLEVRYGTWFWPNLQWFEPSRHEVRWYMLMTTVFIASLLVFYYGVPIGKRKASSWLQKWPPLNGPTYLFVLVLCSGVALAAAVIPPNNFVGLVLFQLSHKAVIFASVFSFLLWYNDRVNVAWLVLFIGVFLFASIFSMIVSPGRRMLLSVFLGPILCFYWVNARHWKPRNTIAALSVAMIAIFVVSLVYSSIRWYNRGPFKEERNASTVIAQLRGLRQRENLFQNLLANKLNYNAQNNVNYALLAKRYVDTDQLTPVPLNTLRFVLSYPVPRRVWKNKPQPLGIVVPHDLARIPSTNWGLGPAGHAAYEGGAFALMLYAMLVALGIRMMDEPLRLQPNNPFLISLHAAALPHVAGFARGDFGVMTTETLECFLFAIALGIACRIMFGTERASPRNRAAGVHLRQGVMPQVRGLSPPRMHR